MIMLGKMVKESGAVSYDLIMEGLKKVVSAKHADKLRKNQPKEEPVAEEAETAAEETQE